MGDCPDNATTKLGAAGQMNVGRYWPLIVLGALFVVVQWPTLQYWWKVWNQPYSYFSHGPLIPFIVGYIIWANKKRIATTPVRQFWPGLLVLVLALVLFVTGNWAQSFSLRAMAFMLMIVGGMLFLAGPRMTLLLLIPVLFLFTMIPIASSWLDSTTGRFQLISAAVGAKLLQLSGYTAELQGTSILSGDLPEPLVVGIPCSGLRTLISLVTFTIFFTYMVRAAWWKKGILLASSFPLSIFINSLRITMIGYAGFWTGSSAAMHKFHDWSGYIGLAICFVMLFGLAKLLKANEFGIPPARAVPDSGMILRPAVVGGGAAGLVAIVVLILAQLSNVYGNTTYLSGKGHLKRENIPMSFGQWEGTNIPISKLVTDWLAKGDLLSRVYTNNMLDGRQVELFIDAARDPEAFHDPHTCLPGGGSPITDERIVTLKFAKPRPLTIKASLLQSTSDYGRILVLHWYMIGPDSMPRTGDVWGRNRNDLMSDLFRLVLHPGDGARLKREQENRQFVWYRFSTDIWQDEKTDYEFLKKFVTEFVENTKGFGE